MTVLPRILAVDDEPNVLRAIARQLREEYAVTTAASGPEALDILKVSEPFAVILSDMQMPAMDGIRFLTLSREVSPQSSRIMLTGLVEQKVAVEAVNAGAVLQFVTKPCDMDTLRGALATGVEHYRLTMAEQELLEGTLRGAVEAMTNVLTIVNPTASGHGMRLQRLASAVAARLGVADRWRLEVTAMLSQIGCVTIPEATLIRYTNGELLSPDEERMIEDHPRVGAELIANVPRLESVAAAIREQRAPYLPAPTFPDGIDGEWATNAMRILKATIDFDLLEHRKIDRDKALAQMRERTNEYDPRILDALEYVLTRELQDYHLEQVMLADLVSGMIMTEALLSDEDVVLLGSGQLLTTQALIRLRNWPTVRADKRVPVLVPRAIGRETLQLKAVAG